MNKLLLLMTAVVSISLVGNTRAEACLVKDPSGNLSVRSSPNGQIVGALKNGTLVVIDSAPLGQEGKASASLQLADVLGTAVSVIGPIAVSVQAITDSTLLIVNADRVRDLGHNDAGVAWAVAEEVARRLNEVLEAFAGTAFGSIRQRLARHLLAHFVGNQVIVR